MNKPIEARVAYHVEYAGERVKLDEAYRGTSRDGTRFRLMGWHGTPDEATWLVLLSKPGWPSNRWEKTHLTVEWED